MGMEEFTDKFRIIHPNLPEPFYGKYAKLDSAVTQPEDSSKCGPEVRPEVIPEVRPEPAPTTAATNPPIPKISLTRRESAAGSTWVKSHHAATPVTESSISNMFSAIRATFRPMSAVVAGLVQADAAVVLDKEKEKELVLKKGTLQAKIPEVRSSSATRGRGLQRPK